MVRVISPWRLHRDALATALATIGPVPPMVTVHPPDEDLAVGAGEVVILDVEVEGLEQRIADLCAAGAPVLVWGGYLDDPAVAHLARLGVVGYLSVLAARGHVRDGVARASVASVAAAPPPGEGRRRSTGLAERQRAALRAYLIDHAELPRAEVARVLGISETTLKTHVRRARASLEPAERASNRAGLRRALVARGWLDPRAVGFGTGHPDAGDPEEKSVP